MSTFRFQINKGLSVLIVTKAGEPLSKKDREGVDLIVVPGSETNWPGYPPDTPITTSDDLVETLLSLNLTGRPANDSLFANLQRAESAHR